MKTLSKTLLCLGVLAALNLAPVAFAGTETPAIEHRQKNQAERIEQGINSGRLTPHEANRLEAQQDRIENAEARVKADGVVTPAERRHLTVRENKANRNIYRKKHNFRHS